MKNILINYFSYLIVIVFFTACIENEIAPWNNEPNPVLFSVISPEKPVQVYLGKSYSESSTNMFAYIEADIYISNNNVNWYALERSANDSTLFFDSKTLFKIEETKEYFLKVELPGKSLFAHTTVPSQQAKINKVDCIVQSSDSSSARALCSINVKFSLPDDKQLGSFLVAFGDEIGTVPLLTGDFYQNDYFFVPKDAMNFELKIITVDPYSKRLRISEDINMTQFHDKVDINALIATYGGVRPNFSNIDNGLGLFGSFVSSTYNVVVKPKNE